MWAGLWGEGMSGARRRRQPRARTAGDRGSEKAAMHANASQHNARPNIVLQRPCHPVLTWVHGQLLAWWGAAAVRAGHAAAVAPHAPAAPAPLPCQASRGRGDGAEPADAGALISAHGNSLWQHRRGRWLLLAAVAKAGRLSGEASIMAQRAASASMAKVCLSSHSKLRCRYAAICYSTRHRRYGCGREMPQPARCPLQRRLALVPPTCWPARVLSAPIALIDASRVLSSVGDAGSQGLIVREGSSASQTLPRHLDSGLSCPQIDTVLLLLVLKLAIEANGCAVGLSERFDVFWIVEQSDCALNAAIEL